MVLSLIIILTLILLWFIISPTFEKVGRFISKRFKKIFDDNKGEEKNE